MRNIEVVVAGAGNRGTVYGAYALNHPAECRVVGVAEPNRERRELFARLHGIPPERCFERYEELFAQPRFADAALLCTQDTQHYDTALRAKACGYHILLEKPIAASSEDCRRIFRLFDSTDQIVAVCHVLRYTQFFSELKRMLEQGCVGKVRALTHSENIGYYHFAHSYVRGNWRREAVSSPMVLAKCCHDLDILRWLVDDEVKSIASFGSLSHFRRENMPAGAPEACAEGCPHKDCAYNALKIYGERAPGVFPRNIIELLNPQKSWQENLRDSGYGRCVYACDNDVVDHQSVNIEFEGGATVAFHISAFTESISRTLSVMGSEGRIWGDLDANTLEYLHFATGKKVKIELPPPDSGHMGGDWGLMRSFIGRLRDEAGQLKTPLEQSLDSHLMAFAAEESRKSGVVIPFQEYKQAWKHMDEAEKVGSAW